MRMRGKKRISVALALAMVLGFAVYFKLWAMDYTISSNEVDLIRREFDLASNEAMDESASWRLRYDEEVDRTTKCVDDLVAVKESFEMKLKDAARISKELDILEKENSRLLERLKSLSQELDAEKLRCNNSRLN